MRTQDMIAEFVLSTRQATARYLVGFDDTNHTRQAPNLPNHVAWCLGHCALTMHRVREKFDGQPLPASDFIVGAKAGDRERFGAESVCFASTPTDDASHYPSLARCVRIFDDAADSLAACARRASDSKLQELIPWGPMQLPLYLAALRMVSHNGMHTGQIADLRRALGFKSIFA